MSALGKPEYPSSSEANQLAVAYLRVRSERIALSMNSIDSSDSTELDAVNRGIAAFFRLANAISKNSISKQESVRVRSAVSTVDEAAKRIMLDMALTKTDMPHEKGLDYIPYMLSASDKSISKQTDNSGRTNAAELQTPVQNGPNRVAMPNTADIEEKTKKEVLSTWVEKEFDKAEKNYLEETGKIEEEFKNFASDASFVLIDGDHKLARALPGIRDALSLAIDAMDAKTATVLAADVIATVENTLNMQIVMMKGGTYEDGSKIAGNLRGAQAAMEMSVDNQAGHKKLMIVVGSIKSSSSKRAEQLNSLENYIINEASDYIETARAKAPAPATA